MISCLLVAFYLCNPNPPAYYPAPQAYYPAPPPAYGYYPPPPYPVGIPVAINIGGWRGGGWGWHRGWVR